MNLQLRGISKAFTQGATRLQILSQLEMQLASGEIVAVVGESGSGKSTLLSILAGFESPDQGEVLWNHESSAGWNEDRWAAFRRSQIGFVFQSYHLIPYLTALENVALPLRLNGMREADPPAQAQLEAVGLGARLNHLSNQLSGGECQRVAIARALVHHPQLLLADEPTGSLDHKTGAQVLDLLFTKIRELRQTALIVTHSKEVATRCDRVLTLREGRLWS